MKFSKIILPFALLLAVSAQETRERGPEPNAFFFQQGAVGRGADNIRVNIVGGDHVFEFVGMDMALAGPTVKGAPYSAEAVTETVQTLADGNRITRRQTAQLYRDSEGRTRRQEKGGMGPLAKAAEGQEMIFIMDPVAGLHYELVVQDKTATKASVSQRKSISPDGQTVGYSRTVTSSGAGPETNIVTITKSGMRKRIAEDEFKIKIAQADPGRVKTENLGKRILEGVEAEGTRSITTIPAGEMGNERPIEIVSERWYSSELQMVVMTRNSDPRMGETTYKLTNVLRGEQMRSLFEPPPDYTVREPGVEIRKKIDKQ